MNYDDIQAELDAGRRELAYADSVAEQRDMLGAEVGRLEAELAAVTRERDDLDKRVLIAEAERDAAVLGRVCKHGHDSSHGHMSSLALEPENMRWCDGPTGIALADALDELRQARDVITAVREQAERWKATTPAGFYPEASAHANAVESCGETIIDILDDAAALSGDAVADSNPTDSSHTPTRDLETTSDVVSGSVIEQSSITNEQQDDREMFSDMAEDASHFTDDEQQRPERPQLHPLAVQQRQRATYPLDESGPVSPQKGTDE